MRCTRCGGRVSRGVTVGATSERHLRADEDAVRRGMMMECVSSAARNTPASEGSEEAQTRRSTTSDRCLVVPQLGAVPAMASAKSSGASAEALRSPSDEREAPADELVSHFFDRIGSLLRPPLQRALGFH